MKKPIKRVAVIHDLCGVGKAALTNIIPVLSMMEIEVCPVPAMILSTHTGGFGMPKIIKLDNYIKEAFHQYNNLNIEFEGIFIGYLGSINNVEEVMDCLQNKTINNGMIVLDPIFADNGHYYSNFNKDYSDRLRELLKYADIITPNYTEACILCGEDVLEETHEENILTACRKLHSMGCDNVVITSVPLMDKEMIGTAVYDGDKDELNLIKSIKQKRSYPGTGDIFTSVLMGMILNGNDLLKSVEKSCCFVEKCMEVSSSYDYPSKEGVLLEKCLKYLYK